MASVQAGHHSNRHNRQELEQNNWQRTFADIRKQQLISLLQPQQTYFVLYMSYRLNHPCIHPCTFQQHTRHCYQLSVSPERDFVRSAGFHDGVFSGILLTYILFCVHVVLKKDNVHFEQKGVRLATVSCESLCQTWGSLSPEQVSFTLVAASFTVPNEYRVGDHSLHSRTLGDLLDPVYPDYWAP